MFFCLFLVIFALTSCLLFVLLSSFPLSSAKAVRDKGSKTAIIADIVILVQAVLYSLHTWIPAS
ncbi:exported hypothetical protein [uncultured Desulfatiglans sp.]|nr:exported hypothetical protein [uncultured Desulfatiglans sp.]